MQADLAEQILIQLEISLPADPGAPPVLPGDAARSPPVENTGGLSAPSAAENSDPGVIGPPEPPAPDTPSR